MKVYNSINGIFLFIIIFLSWAYLLGKECPCNVEKEPSCVRNEFYGIQLNHFVLFSILGLFFPSYFFTFQGFGILWEVLEFILDKNPILVIKYIGGCLKSAPPDYIHKNNHPSNYTVYKNIEKPLNIIDKFFNIKNSTLHVWHGSPAELVPNFFGFLLGMYINKHILRFLKLKKSKSKK
jgi:hypothetical protein